jgi:hypothetical protein
MIRVYLSQTEFMVLNFVGKLRSQVTSSHGTDMLQDTTLNGLQISCDGVITEYAVAKYLNLHLDLNCDFREFGADLVSAKGARIDVKSTRTAGGNLNAVGWSNGKTADIFVLTEILASCVGIVGWIHRESFLRNENVVTPKGRKPYYSVSRDKLTPFYEQADAETL